MTVARGLMRQIIVTVALARLAAHQGTTQSATLSELILKAERDVLATLGDAGRETYNACKPITG